MNTLKDEMVKVYYKTYLSNGYNKVRAYMKVHPNATYDSANAEAAEFHRKILVKPCIKEFQEMLKEEIPAEIIVQAIQKEIKNSKERKAGIDHWLEITGLKEAEKHKIGELIPEQERSIIDKYILGNRLRKI